MACYITNRALIRPLLKKTLYELFRGKKPNVEYFRVFGYKYFVLNNDKDHLKKFDSKPDEGISSSAATTAATATGGDERGEAC